MSADTFQDSISTLQNFLCIEAPAAVQHLSSSFDKLHQVGRAGSSLHPPQVALAVTLRGATPLVSLATNKHIAKQYLESWGKHLSEAVSLALLNICRRLGRLVR